MTVAACIELCLTTGGSSVYALDDAPSTTETKLTQSAVIKLPDGVEYFDAIIGKGDEAQEGKSVQFLWVLRRSNG